MALNCKCGIQYNDLSQITDNSSFNWQTIGIGNVNLANVYKPLLSNIEMNPTLLPTYGNATLYAGHSNRHQSDCGYNTNSANGNRLNEWASINGCILIYKPTFLQIDLALGGQRHLERPLSTVKFKNA